MAELQVGQEAPDFALRDESRQEVKLSDFRGKKRVVLVFYPFDFSIPCQGEMCEIRDMWADVEGTDAEVFGISRDSIHAHKAWKEQQGFKHRLLADMKGDVARSYGAWNDAVGVAERLTVIIDKDGKVEWTDRSENLGTARDQQSMLSALKGKH